MAEILHLRVLTPEREVLDANVESVTAEGSLGQFAVLPKHIPFLTSLEPGILAYGPLGRPEGTIVVKGGYVEVRDDDVTVLADEALRVEELDAAAAAGEVERAQAALAEAPFGHPEHEQARRELRWAQLCAAVAR